MELKAKVIHGLKWMTISKFVAQIFSWVATFVIIRLLTQEDYGIVAIISATFEIVTIIATHGFSSSLVRKQSKSYILSSQIFTISLFVNVFLAALVIYFSSHISDFYASPELANVVVLVACFIPLNSLIIVPSAYLDIDMNFKSRAICDTSAAFINTIVALTLAFYGFGYWALIIGTLSNLLCRTALYIYVSDARFFITLNFSGCRETLSFAYKLQLNSILWFSYNKLDTLLVGRLLGLQKLGVYNVGLEIASIPMVKAASIINQVGFSAFSTLKGDMCKANVYLRKALFSSSLLIFPVFLGMASVSNEVILLLIGEQWALAGPVMAIFCWAFPFRMLNMVIQNYTNGMGYAGFALKNSLIISLILIFAIIMGAQHGIIETAFAWVIGFVIAFSIVLLRSSVVLKIPFKMLLCWLMPFLNSVSMFLLLYFMQASFLLEQSLLVSLIVKMLIGTLYIVGTYILFYKKYLLEFYLSRKEKNSSTG
ncbi:lipopolysaccharide biosynthesis protein [Paraglaciecola sp.]|uniref:lipopolysaccharide biosynthesis protein n=1 Tax=Paraglaciecola sp. TaxID=1920173 RepID=UPI003EF63594